jgi:hypothetical protein
LTRFSAAYEGAGTLRRSARLRPPNDEEDLVMWTTLFGITVIVAIMVTAAAKWMEPSSRKVRS